MIGPGTAGPRPCATVDVVIVAWNHGSWLRRCLASVSAQSQRNFQLGRIFLVDNASTEPVHRTMAPSSVLTIVTNPSNIGFAAGCNQAAAQSRSTYVLFLNPDTRLQPDAIARAVALMEARDGADVGLVGLRLTDPTGVAQRTCGRFPGLREFTNQTLGLSAVAPRRFPGLRMTTWAHDRTMDVDHASAAALLVRRSVFSALGGFNERLFLYLEDIDLALRARQIGWRTRFCADAEVEHALGWTSGGHRYWRLAHAWRSRIVYGRTHLSAPAAAALAGVTLVGAPLARLGQAVLRASPRLAVDALRAWLRLWQLIASDAFRGRYASPRRPAHPAACTEAQPPREASPI